MIKKIAKTKKLVLYLEKSNGTIFIKPTLYKNGRFSQKKNKGEIGKAVSRGKSFSELGKAIREQFEKCD